MIVPVQRKLRQRRSCCSWERICSARLRLGFGCGRLIADDDDDDRNETSSFVVLNRGGGYCVGWATDKGWPAVCAVGQRRCVDNCAWNDWSDVSQLFTQLGAVVVVVDVVTGTVAFASLDSQLVGGGGANGQDLSRPLGLFGRQRARNSLGCKISRFQAFPTTSLRFAISCSACQTVWVSCMSECMALQLWGISSSMRVLVVATEVAT